MKYKKMSFIARHIALLIVMIGCFLMNEYSSVVVCMFVYLMDYYRRLDYENDRTISFYDIKKAQECVKYKS